jgi:phage terminase large subunit
VQKLVDALNGRFHYKQCLAYLGYKAGLTVILPAGRRAGKSDFFAEILIEDVEKYKKPCLYLASTQESAREIMWPKLYARILNNKNWKINESKMEAEHISSKAVIRIRGVEKVDNLAGKAYRVVVADEYALWKRDPELTVKQILVPMIADYNGQIMFGSSKRGKNHFFELVERAKRNEDDYLVQEFTIFDNPYISEKGKQRILKEYESEDDPLYRQEIKNEWVTFQGMVFALPAESYTTKRWDQADLDHSYHIRGVDHGFSPDPTACVWLAYNDRKGYWLLYSEYKQTKLLIHQHKEIITKQEPFIINETIADIDPQVIAEYDNIGLSMTPAGKYDKQARLLLLVNALKAGRLKIADNCKMLLKEMAAYEWEQDGNDHLIDALLYAYNNNKIEMKKKDDEEEYRPNRYDTYSQDFG